MQSTGTVWHFCPLTRWQRSYISVKLWLDRVAALGLLVLLTPLFLLIAAAVKGHDGGSVLFRQKRIGRNGTVFTIWKFRTMRTSAPSNVPTDQLESPERMITPLGRFLRRSSLDELPQLWQILKGEMSFVGPRPCLVNQTELHAARHACGVEQLRPGLTGWAQVNGRDTVSDMEKVLLDVEYLQRMSFWFDLRCVLLTVVRVLRHDGIVEGKTGCKL